MAAIFTGVHAVLREELKDLKGGSARTWQNFYDVLWHIATVRYVTFEQLKAAFKEQVWCIKCVTKDILKGLAGKGFLNISDQGVLTITAKGLNLLKTYSNHNTDIIKLPEGEGLRDGIYNAGALLELLKRPDFYALFYPDFYRDPKDAQPFLIPDGALVLKREGLAKLVFIEIERKKPDWRRHLEGKRANYEHIGQDPGTWAVFWKDWSAALKLGYCAREDFKFSVLCIGDFKADWPGWEFIGD